MSARITLAAARPDDTGTEAGPVEPATPRCTLCRHSKRDHSDRRDHTPSNVVPRRPWCPRLQHNLRLRRPGRPPRRHHRSRADGTGLVTPARLLVIGLYSAAYLGAVWMGADAAHHSEDLYAAGLFVTSSGLLLGIHREFRNAGRLVRVVAAYRHRQVLAITADAAAIECATARPPGCRCEMWWTSLGVLHDLECPAHAQQEDAR